VTEVCELPAKHKYFIDYIMRLQYKLKFIEWPKNSTFVECPAEDIPLPERCIDILLSYNCLDHGWNIEKALKECFRISKVAFISFDCRGNNPAEFNRRQARNDIDHKQFITTDLVKEILNGISGCVWSQRIIQCPAFPKIYLELIHAD